LVAAVVPAGLLVATVSGVLLLPQADKRRQVAKKQVVQKEVAKEQMAKEPLSFCMVAFF
jgi:hypothetical protein